jgi:hypothetical protein
MDSKLEVVLSRTFDCKPLVTVNNFPGVHADLTPTQMRALAATLCRAAEECELQPMGHKHFKPKKRIYDVMVNK